MAKLNSELKEMEMNRMHYLIPILFFIIKTTQRKARIINRVMLLALISAVVVFVPFFIFILPIITQKIDSLIIGIIITLVSVVIWMLLLAGLLFWKYPWVVKK